MKTGFWYWVRTFSPIVKLRPLLTFRARLRTKILRLRKRLFGHLWDYSLARVTGQDANLNEVLQFRRATPLGPKGALIQLPKDNVIFRHLLDFGHWELEESAFLVSQLKRIEKHKRKQGILLLDIGANTGLVTLQTLLATKTRPRAVLVEPINQHIQAIEFNLRELAQRFDIELVSFALADDGGTATIYTENQNHGNSSLNSELVPNQSSQEREITLMGVADFSEQYLSGEERIVLKSDTQGSDALILSRIPQEVWERIDAAVIEVWAVPEIVEADVSQCLSYWSNFTVVSWKAGFSRSISLDEVADFWLSKSSESKNLFLRR